VRKGRTLRSTIPKPGIHRITPREPPSPPCKGRVRGGGSRGLEDRTLLRSDGATVPPCKEGVRGGGGRGLEDRTLPRRRPAPPCKGGVGGIDSEASATQHAAPADAATRTLLRIAPLVEGGR